MLSAFPNTWLAIIFILTGLNKSISPYTAPLAAFNNSLLTPLLINKKLSPYIAQVSIK